MHTHCGILGIGRSPATECSTPSETLYECDGVLGSRFGSTHTVCPASSWDVIMSHMETNNLSDKKVEYQKEFCRWFGNELTSPCEDMSFCRTRTDEDRAQHPYDSKRCVHEMHDMSQDFIQRFGRPSPSEMDTLSKLNTHLNTASEEAITAEHCAQIPYDSTGKWNPKLPGLEINSHGSCQMSTCRTRVNGLQGLCIDPSRTPADFQTLFDEVAKE